MRRYCLISPCRDEAQYMERTLESVTGQSEPPALWVIVDDGSTDETPGILREWASRFDFIRIVTRADRGSRKVGPGVIDAFYAGYEMIAPGEFDFLCKLDLDLDLPPRYFEILMDKMEADPRLGTCSGKPYMLLDGKLVSEKCGDENSVGMTKFYRVECFEQIGGFVRQVMWDGIDGHRCRLTRPPLIVGGLAMWWGYAKSMLAGAPRYGDDDFRRFLRSYQWRCLFLGKTEATRRLNAAQQSVWEARRGS